MAFQIPGELPPGFRKFILMDLPLRKRVLFTFIIIFFGSLLLEGTTRLFLSDKKPAPWVPPGVTQFNERLGWSPKPLSNGISNPAGYKIAYRINSKGLRDDETSYEKPEGIFRIVLLGDSNTFGFGVPIEKHFSTLLEGYYKGVEVINMGVNAFGVDQELLYLRSEGFRYEPDLVIAYVPHYGAHRHMHTKRFGKKKPRFVLVDRELVLTNSPVVKSNSVTPGILRKLHRWVKRHSKAYKILYTGIVNKILGLNSQKRKETRESRKQQDKKNLEDVAFRKELHDLGEALIFDMYKKSLNHGATFVLITKIEELHQACLEKGILYLDVGKAMRNKKFRLPDKGAHTNESGNGVLAWEIAKFLNANDLIPIKHLNH